MKPSRTPLHGQRISHLPKSCVPKSHRFRLYSRPHQHQYGASIPSILRLNRADTTQIAQRFPHVAGPRRMILLPDDLGKGGSLQNGSAPPARLQVEAKGNLKRWSAAFYLGLHRPKMMSRKQTQRKKSAFRKPSDEANDTSSFKPFVATCGSLLIGQAPCDHFPQALSIS